MQPNVQLLLEKLQRFSPRRLAEVADFIDFLQQRDQDSNLRQNYTSASETVFSQLWDNDDDAIYDTL